MLDFLKSLLHPNPTEAMMSSLECIGWWGRSSKLIDFRPGCCRCRPQSTNRKKKLRTFELFSTIEPVQLIRIILVYTVIDAVSNAMLAGANGRWQILADANDC